MYSSSGGCYMPACSENVLIYLLSHPAMSLSLSQVRPLLSALAAA